MVKRFVEDAKSHPGVWFARRPDIVRAWPGAVVTPERQDDQGAAKMLIE